MVSKLVSRLIGWTVVLLSAVGSALFIISLVSKDFPTEMSSSTLRKTKGERRYFSYNWVIHDSNNSRLVMLRIWME